MLRTHPNGNKKTEHTQVNLTYIIGTYPGLTTTFIDREIVSLRRLGVKLSIVSIRRPWTPLSAEQKALQTGVEYLLPVSWFAFLGAHLRYALTTPAAYFGTLLYLLARPHPSLKSRLKTFLHFLEGVYAARFVKNSQPDHVHAHFIDRAATVALVVSRLLKVPYSLTAHASDIYVDPVLLGEKIAEAKFVATCTGYNRAYLAQAGENRFSQKLKCIYHGLDSSKYQRLNPAVTPKPVLLSVGQLKERKGFRYLLDACRELSDRGVDYECHIVGEGPLRAELEAQIQGLGLQERVMLCGAMPHEEVIRKYEQAAVFVLPAILGSDGDRDGIPNVILEAMAMELPVVSTRHSGVPEVVEDGTNGLLVPPADAGALADALQVLLADPQRQRRLGRSGRLTVQEKFDPERNVQRLLHEFMA